MLNPIKIFRDEEECCFIEPSINSTRFSIRFKKADDPEIILAKRLMRFIQQRADKIPILRRVAIKGYDISFLITNQHLEEMYKEKVIDFMINFMKDIDSDIKDLKLQMSARARAVSSQYLGDFK